MTLMEFMQQNQCLIFLNSSTDVGKATLIDNIPADILKMGFYEINPYKTGYDSTSI